MTLSNPTNCFADGAACTADNDCLSDYCNDCGKCSAAGTGNATPCPSGRTSISKFETADSGNSTTVTTATSHGLSNDTQIKISGTSN